MIQTTISPGMLAILQDRAKAFEHVVLVMNTPNKNGRIYPTDVVVAALANVKYPLLGCFMPDLSGGFVPITKVSHKVMSMRIDGDNVIANIVILDLTPLGRILRTLTDLNGEQDYRTSGVCMVDPKGVVSDFDIVSVGALPPGQGA